MPKATDNTPSEADIIFNRTNVALARSQRLIQSWLPPKTAEETANAKTEEELRKEDEELFKPAPELLGVGAIAPESEADGLIKRRGPSNQRLLEQLLGKKAAKGHIASAKAPNRSSNTQSAAQTGKLSGQALIAEDSDDEEEGRASMVASKSARGTKRAPVLKKQADNSEHANVEDAGRAVENETVEAIAVTQPRAASTDEDEVKPTKKRAVSYLDQLLAEKASKKKKKKQKVGVVGT